MDELPASNGGTIRSGAVDHHCFGCGQLNTAGLQLVFTDDPEGDGVIAPFKAAPHVEGYTGIVHGGIITTVLDEVMAWSLYRHDILAVTGQLTTRYRRPIRIGEATIATGTMVRDRGRAIEMRGEVRRQSDGKLLADATATFVRVHPSQAQAWQGQYGESRTEEVPH